MEGKDLLSQRIDYEIRLISMNRGKDDKAKKNMVLS
jgi:hypothetical protein